MEENYQGYNQPEYENDDPRKGANKSILGYRIVIIILAVILAAITVLYYNIHRQQQADYDLLVIDRDSIQNNLSDLMQDFDDLQLSNDTPFAPDGHRTPAGRLADAAAQTGAFVESGQNQAI